MTREEIRAIWARWSHRNDLGGDMAAIEELAQARIRDRMMIWGDVFPAGDADAVTASMADAGNLWVSAGLIEIFRLAEDAENHAREVTVFEGAASDFILRKSQAQGPRVMMRNRKAYPDDSRDGGDDSGAERGLAARR